MWKITRVVVVLTKEAEVWGDERVRRKCLQLNQIAYPFSSASPITRPITPLQIEPQHASSNTVDNDTTKKTYMNEKKSQQRLEYMVRSLFPEQRVIINARKEADIRSSITQQFLEIDVSFPKFLVLLSSLILSFLLHYCPTIITIHLT